MSTIDIIISVVLLLGLITGLRAGLIKQITSLLGLIAGMFLGRILYIPVGDWLMDFLNTSMEIARGVAFVLILVGVPLLFSFVGWLVSKILGVIKLGWLNRLLGAFLGVLKYALLVGIIITGVEIFDAQSTFIVKEKKKASVLYYPLYGITGFFLDEVVENNSFRN